MSQHVDFWFEFASTYSYLAISRIEAEAAAHKVQIRWRPFLLGPIFAAQGWSTTPFRLYPNKGRYMWRDLERRAEKLGLPLQRPAEDRMDAFPQNSVLAARVALVALEPPWGKEYCKALYRMQFAEQRNIAERATIEEAILAAGGDADHVMAWAVEETNKQRLRANVEEAQRLGLFGAPSFVVGEELFWGDDRLEDALEWAGAKP